MLNLLNSMSEMSKVDQKDNILTKTHLAWSSLTSFCQGLSIYRIHINLWQLHLSIGDLLNAWSLDLLVRYGYGPSPRIIRQKSSGRNLTQAKDGQGVEIKDDLGWFELSFISRG